MALASPVSFTLHPAEIARSFNAKTLSSGRSLLKQIQIEYFDSEDARRTQNNEAFSDKSAGATAKGAAKGQFIFARVEESAATNAKSYQVGISRHADNADSQIICRCNCSVGLNCQHSAAVLLRLLEIESPTLDVSPPPAKGPVANWLTELDQNAQSHLELNDASAEPDKVIYVLQEGLQGVNATIKRSNRGKKGDYLKGTKIAISDFRYYMPHWIADEDQQILNLLTRRDSQHEKFGELFGDVGYFAFQKMLQTQRCFWDENRIPLTQTSSAKLSLSWDESRQGKQVQLDLEGYDNWEIIYTEPAMFIDLDYLKVGVIDTDISADKLKLLKEMPRMATKYLPYLAEKLLRSFTLSQLPLPVHLPIESVSNICRPKLLMTMMSSADGESLQPAVQLKFLYGDCQLEELAVKEPLTVIRKGSLRYQIQRDLELESRAEQQLAQLGLQLLVTKSPLTANATYWTVGDMPEALQAWLDFIDYQVPLWQQQGWLVETKKNFDLNVVESQLDILIEDDDRGWFSLALTADIDGVRLPLLPIIAQWLHQHGEPTDNARMLLPTPSGKKILLNFERIKPLIGVIQELFTQKSPEKIRLPQSRAMLLNELQGLNNSSALNGVTSVKPVKSPASSTTELQMVSGQRVLALAKKLKKFNGIAEVSKPEGLNATLRDYQAEGLNWLCFLREYHLGGVLADDMGLGKTLQALAFILKQRQLGQLPQGALIICPTSLVGNWFNEAAKFTPNLKVVISQGNKRKDVLESMTEADIVVTTYPLISRDQSYYEQRRFDVLILDEAQLIKNRQAKVTQVVKALDADFKLCLTGTPLENHLGELKSIMDFCLPGLLGEQKSFMQIFRSPIEKHQDAAAAKSLKQRIAPFLLRRTKDQVASELPAKTEIDVLLELEKDQRNLYESIRIAMEKKLRELFARTGVSGNHIAFFDALLKLRQSCCDARLVKLESAAQVTTNAKLGWLHDNLPEMIEEGRRVLIFSQFTSMLSLIEQELTGLDISFSKLTGETRDRQSQIDAFQQGNNSVFLISLKAGGTGLNLTAADTVIHYDPWWNPAAERQATDRAYRIGQDKPVFVYKLITQGTVEEKIQQMQLYKQSLSDSIFSVDNQQVWQGDADDLMALLN